MNNKQAKINELKQKWFDLLMEVEKAKTPLTKNQINKIVDLHFEVEEFVK